MKPTTPLIEVLERHGTNVLQRLISAGLPVVDTRIGRRIVVRSLHLMYPSMLDEEERSRLEELGVIRQAEEEGGWETVAPYPISGAEPTPEWIEWDELLARLEAGNPLGAIKDTLARYEKAYGLANDAAEELSVSEPADGNFFICKGPTWLVRYNGEEVYLKHRKGLHFLGHLLDRPYDRISCLDLERFVNGVGRLEVAGHDQSNLLSEKDRKAFQAIVDKGLDRIERAREQGREAVEEAEEKMAKIRSYCADKGLIITNNWRVIQRDKTPKSTHNARSNVTKQLKLAIDEIRKELPGLGEHLAESINTGSSCVYNPAPEAEKRWEVTM